MQLIPYSGINVPGLDRTGVCLATKNLKELDEFNFSSQIPSMFNQDLHLKEFPSEGWEDILKEYCLSLPGWNNWKTFIHDISYFNYIRKDNGKRVYGFYEKDTYLVCQVYHENDEYRVVFYNVICTSPVSGGYVAEKKRVDTYLTNEDTKYYYTSTDFTTAEPFYFEEVSDGEIEEYLKATSSSTYWYNSTDGKILPREEMPENPAPLYGIKYSPNGSAVSFPAGEQNNLNVVFTEDPRIERQFSSYLESQTYCAPCFPIISYVNLDNFFIIPSKPDKNWYTTVYLNISDFSGFSYETSGNDWGWTFCGDVCGRHSNHRIIKGPKCSFYTPNWEAIPYLSATLDFYIMTSRGTAPISPYIRPDEEIVFDVELEDKTFNYLYDDYEFVDGVAKDIHYKFVPTTPTMWESEAFLPKSIFVPLYCYNPKKKVTVTLKEYPKGLFETTSKQGTLTWNRALIVNFAASLPSTGRLVFTLTLTGMGNDPCKKNCSCEIEDKKYETVIEFTSDVSLENKVTIDPADLEHSWQENTLTVMLAENQTVTVDNIPLGAKYEISVNSEDPCDENEYNIDNGEGGSSGTIGFDSEGYLQQDTDVSVEAQLGETLDEYLERLRQKGYEALAENLKLENVEFSIDDERIKLGDLVTVDMPEFDFKAVVRVTGVKLKSQDNQTIRTISVGTPLKILRKPRI